MFTLFAAILLMKLFQDQEGEPIPFPTDLRAWALILLGPLSGAAQQWIMSKTLPALKEGINIFGKVWVWEPGAWSKRLYALGISLVLPTFIYVVVGNWIFGWWDYSREAHVAYMGVAFAASQYIHGFSLPKSPQVVPPMGYTAVSLQELQSAVPPSAYKMPTNTVAPTSSMNPGPEDNLPEFGPPTGPEEIVAAHRILEVPNKDLEHSEDILEALKELIPNAESITVFQGFDGPSEYVTITTADGASIPVQMRIGNVYTKFWVE